MDNKYHAISCHFYDELEVLAVKKVISKITYFENENEMTIEDLIVDFKTKNKEEYCGLIQCSMSKLGLNNSPLSDRIYFADLIPEGTLSLKKYGLIKTYL